MKKTFFNKLLLTSLGLLLMVTLGACNNSKPPVIEKFTVVFDVNAGDDVVQNEPSTVRVDSGKTVSKPSPDPIRTGYDFLGWYTNETGTGQPFDFTSPITQNNFVLYAKWSITIIYHLLTFDYGDDRENTTVQIPDHQTLSEPQHPTRIGYRFDGWYIDEDLTSKYNFSSTVNTGFTLYAKWIQVFTVTFDFNYEGSPADVVEVIDLNGFATEPTVPERENFTFAGWFSNEDLTISYEFNQVISNTIVYAKWIDSTSTNTFSVEFVYNYEGSPNNVLVQVVEGAIVTQPSTTRTNYRFGGWFIDNETFQNRFFTATTPVADDLVLYAKWIRIHQLVIDYNYSGAINPSPIVVDENTAITNVQNPSRIGYTFAGWSNESKGLIGYNLTNGIGQNTTIYAQWSKINVFEAEHLDFSNFFGWGFSGNATGTDAIVLDTTGIGQASNNRFVTYLYGKGITLNFEIYSDRNVDNVVLTLRLSGEVKDFFIQSTKTIGLLEEEPVYTIKVNNQTIQYSNISFTNVPSQSDNTLLPFKDFVISININLVEGKNVISLITDNELGMGGTMSATAPMIDCLKLTTYAILTWTPKLDNY